MHPRANSFAWKNSFARSRLRSQQEDSRNTALTLALTSGVFSGAEMGIDLGEEVVQRFRGRDRPLECGPLTESYNLLRRILQANTVGGAVRAKHFYARCGQIGLQAHHIDMLVSSRLHLPLLVSFGDEAGGSSEPHREDCHLSGPARIRTARSKP